MKKRVLISSCLLGVMCKYNGGSNMMKKEKLDELMEKYDLIPVCPESYGGLYAPRLPSERVGDKVLSKDGTDVTARYKKGAEATLYIAKLYGAELAILKERSPSCASGKIYDGTFTGTVINGYGVAAELLEKNGIRVIGESDA